MTSPYLGDIFEPCFTRILVSPIGTAALPHLEPVCASISSAPFSLSNLDILRPPCALPEHNTVSHPIPTVTIPPSLWSSIHGAHASTLADTVRTPEVAAALEEVLPAVSAISTLRITAVPEVAPPAALAAALAAAAAPAPPATAAPALTEEHRLRDLVPGRRVGAWIAVASVQEAEDKRDAVLEALHAFRELEDGHIPGFLVIVGVDDSIVVHEPKFDNNIDSSADDSSLDLVSNGRLVLPRSAFFDTNAPAAAAAAAARAAAATHIRSVIQTALCFADASISLSEACARLASSALLLGAVRDAKTYSAQAIDTPTIAADGEVETSCWRGAAAQTAAAAAFVQALEDEFTTYTPVLLISHALSLAPPTAPLTPAPPSPFRSPSPPIVSAVERAKRMITELCTVSFTAYRDSGLLLSAGLATVAAAAAGSPQTWALRTLALADKITETHRTWSAQPPPPPRPLPSASPRRTSVSTIMHRAEIDALAGLRTGSDALAELHSLFLTAKVAGEGYTGGMRFAAAAHAAARAPATRALVVPLVTAALKPFGLDGLLTGNVNVFSAPTINEPHLGEVDILDISQVKAAVETVATLPKHAPPPDTPHPPPNSDIIIAVLPLVLRLMVPGTRLSRFAAAAAAALTAAAPPPPPPLAAALATISVAPASQQSHLVDALCDIHVSLRGCRLARQPTPGSDVVGRIPALVGVWLPHVARTGKLPPIPRDAPAPLVTHNVVAGCAVLPPAYLQMDTGEEPTARPYFLRDPGTRSDIFLVRSPKMEQRASLAMASPSTPASALEALSLTERIVPTGLDFAVIMAVVNPFVLSGHVTVESVTVQAAGTSFTLPAASAPVVLHPRLVSCPSAMPSLAAGDLSSQLTAVVQLPATAPQGVYRVTSAVLRVLPSHAETGNIDIVAPIAAYAPTYFLAVHTTLPAAHRTSTRDLVISSVGTGDTKWTFSDIYARNIYNIYEAQDSEYDWTDGRVLHTSSLRVHNCTDSSSDISVILPFSTQIHGLKLRGRLMVQHHAAPAPTTLPLTVPAPAELTPLPTPPPGSAVPAVALATFTNTSDSATAYVACDGAPEWFCGAVAPGDTVNIVLPLDNLVVTTVDGVRGFSVACRTGASAGSVFVPLVLPPMPPLQLSADTSVGDHGLCNVSVVVRARVRDAILIDAEAVGAQLLGGQTRVVPADKLVPAARDKTSWPADVQDDSDDVYYEHHTVLQLLPAVSADAVLGLRATCGRETVSITVSL